MMETQTTHTYFCDECGKSTQVTNKIRRGMQIVRPSYPDGWRRMYNGACEIDLCPEHVVKVETRVVSEL